MTMSGARMQALRLATGLYGKEIAAALGVTDETVSRWERGRVGISQSVEYAFEALVRDPERVAGIRAARPKRKRKKSKEF